MECRERFLLLIPALPKVTVVLPTAHGGSLVPRWVSVGHFPGANDLRFCICVTIRARILASSIVRSFHDQGGGGHLVSPEVIRVPRMRWWTGRAGAFPGIIRPWRLGVSLIERCRASAASGALGPCNEGVEIAMLLAQLSAPRSGPDERLAASCLSGETPTHYMYTDNSSCT